MLQPVVHHNSDGPNSNESSFDSSPDDHDFMDRNWEHGLVFVFSFYFAFSIKYYFIDFQLLYPCFFCNQ